MQSHSGCLEVGVSTFESWGDRIQPITDGEGDRLLLPLAENIKITGTCQKVPGRRVHPSTPEDVLPGEPRRAAAQLWAHSWPLQDSWVPGPGSGLFEQETQEGAEALSLLCSYETYLGENQTPR